jgi:hypothetical protein
MQIFTHKLKFKNIQGESFSVGTSTLTPFSSRLSLGSPEAVRQNQGFAFLFQQPTVIIIEENGRAYRFPIRDYHKNIMISLWLITVVCALITLCLSRTRSVLRNSKRTTLLEEYYVRSRTNE